MGRKNYTIEQIIVKLREIEILCNQGKPWLKQLGKLKSPQIHTIVGVVSTVE